MKPHAPSLRAGLLRWVMPPLLLAVAGAAAITYFSAYDTASAVQDRLLLGSARVVTEQLRFEDGGFLLHIPPAALELFQASQTDRIYYRVTTGSGQLLAGYEDLATPSAALQPELPYFFDTLVRDQQARAVAYLQPVVGTPDGLPVLVEISQTMNGHASLARGLWMQSLLQQLVILALAAGFIALGLRQGLLPLIRLRDRVLARQPGTLELLQADSVPAELAPLVAALNDYISRLEAHAGAQRIFVQNAAHQLKTPFALLTTQVAYASRNADGAGRGEALAGIRRTLAQAVRLLNQLLTLSAAEAQAQGASSLVLSQASPAPSSAASSVSPTRLDLMTARVLEDMAGLALAKNIDLGYEHAGTWPLVAGSPLALREIVLNLVDNAIRYTPAGGVVTVRLQADAGVVLLVVEDNGPGIAPALRERVFERFYRVDDTRSDGCGLGLPIVREFALRLGASVVLATAASGQGLRIAVTFPAVSEAIAACGKAPRNQGSPSRPAHL